MQEIKEEVMRYTQTDNYFKSGVQEDSDPSVRIFLEFSQHFLKIFI